MSIPVLSNVSLRLFVTKGDIGLRCKLSTFKGTDAERSKCTIFISCKSSKWLEWPAKRSHICSDSFLGSIVQFSQKETGSLQTKGGPNPRSWVWHFLLVLPSKLNVCWVRAPQLYRVRIDRAAMLESKYWLNVNMQRSVEKLTSSRRIASPCLQSHQWQTNICHSVERGQPGISPYWEGECSKRFACGCSHLRCRTWVV